MGFYLFLDSSALRTNRCCRRSERTTRQYPYILTFPILKLLLFIAPALCADVMIIGRDTFSVVTGVFQQMFITDSGVLVGPPNGHVDDTFVCIGDISSARTDASNRRSVSPDCEFDYSLSLTYWDSGQKTR